MAFILHTAAGFFGDLGDALHPISASALVLGGQQTSILFPQKAGKAVFYPDKHKSLIERADLHPDKSADQRYGDALLVRHSGVAAGQKLYEQLRLRMLGRLSLPQEKASSRRHPDIASRSYFVADNLPAVAMAEFVQLDFRNPAEVFK